MKPVHWLFVISLGLFVSSIGFVIAAERTVRTAPPQAVVAEQPAAAPVATVKQIMSGVVAPSATSIWDSVATTVSAAGIDEKMPRTDEEWASVATSAAVLADSAGMLLASGRAVDTGDWPKMAQAMAAAAAKALKAAEAHSTDGILEVGDEINQTCDNCHERYSRN